MANINFVPNEYIQQRECRRANFMYVFLFVALMFAIGLTFSIVKARQKAVESKLAILDSKLVNSKDQIVQLDELKQKGKTIMRTAMMTSELLEPVPRSIILASVTNNLPAGVSLLGLKLVEKEVKSSSVSGPGSSQYQKASAAAGVESVEKKVIETLIEIKGLAPSGLGVAGYIRRLGTSVLFDDVSLVESKEHEIDEAKFREFKLSAKLKGNIAVSKKDIDGIRFNRRNDLKVL